MSDERSHQSQQPEVPEGGRARVPGQYDALNSCSFGVTPSGSHYVVDPGGRLVECLYGGNPLDRLRHRLAFARRTFFSRFGQEPDFYLVSFHMIREAEEWAIDNIRMVSLGPIRCVEKKIIVDGCEIATVTGPEGLVIPVKRGILDSDYEFGRRQDSL